MTEVADQFEFPADTRTVTDIIAAGLNNEAKAIAFSHLTEEFQPASHISDLGNSRQGDHPVWAYTSQRVRDYSLSFLGVGAIAKAYAETSRDLVLKLTDLGEKLARPLGGHLLFLSSEVGPTLLEIFGATQTRSSKGIRSVENRLKIMRTLNEVRMIAITDLADTQTISAVTENTDHMRRAGMLTKQDSRAGSPHALWVVDTIAGRIEVTDHMGNARRDVSEVITRLSSQNPGKPFSSIDIARLLPASYGFAANPPRTVELVAHALSNMASAARPDIKKHDQGIDLERQFLSVNDEQASLFSRVLAIVDAAIEGGGDFAQQGETALQQVLSDTPTVRHLIEKGYRHSQAAKLEQSKLIGGLILDIVAESDEPITRRQIVDALATLDVHVHFETVSRYVKKHLEAGRIENRSHESGLSRYVIPDAEESE